MRKSLQFALNHYGVQVTVIDSDARFNACNMKDYDFVILDPWTWAAKGKMTNYDRLSLLWFRCC